MARPCSGYTSDYAKARCFCHLQLRDRQSYVWPFRNSGDPYDCSAFLECDGYRPVVLSGGRFKRTCDSALDPSEPLSCPGCSAIDTVTGDEGSGRGRICRTASSLVDPGATNVQCTEREPGMLCHWWLLPAGLYQDPYDVSGMLTMRCPTDTLSALYAPAPSPEVCADDATVFSNAQQACVLRDAEWAPFRKTCPARHATLVTDDGSSVLSKCESSYMGSDYADADAPPTLTPDLPPAALAPGRRLFEQAWELEVDLSQHSTLRMHEGVATLHGARQQLATLFQPPVDTNCKNPELCCKEQLNKAARNRCLPSTRTVAAIRYPLADMCNGDKMCGSNPGAGFAFCRCTYPSIQERGYEPTSCPYKATQRCRVRFN
ncbi:hypothetical protein HYH03_003637 [Edaphochlamys debaryana]|uniref:Uncharacterized protein n=1 Tax=Edaphochlamys debaryana TaxID=47281 RepID=A0A835Y983_9CHLO|nr:hypothetical protein HYH03_003637 [Edaphochlamys debaryana]|eukprot:KAG2498378.1 hypothetical protein HYH03_003637 [Edaphochlamys debaryana]